MSAQSTSDRIEDGRPFLRVYGLLIRAAELHGTVTYPQIAELMGLPRQGSNTGRRIGEMLGAITDRERAAGRPMLSAVAVSSTNRKPGAGFASLAEQHGSLSPSATEAEKETYWRSELARVYKEWGT